MNGIEKFLVKSGFTPCLNCAEHEPVYEKDGVFVRVNRLRKSWEIGFPPHSMFSDGWLAKMAPRNFGKEAKEYHRLIDAAHAIAAELQKINSWETWDDDQDGPRPRPKADMMMATIPSFRLTDKEKWVICQFHRQDNKCSRDCPLLSECDIIRSMFSDADNQKGEEK